MSKVSPGLVDFAGVCLEFITLTVWSDPLKIQALLNIPWMVWVTIRPSVDCLPRSEKSGGYDQHRRVLRYDLP